MEKAFKYSFRVTASSFVKYKHLCELCGRQNYSTDGVNKLQFIQNLRAGDLQKHSDSHAEKIKSLTEEHLISRFRNLEKLDIVNYDTLDALPLLAKHPFTISNRVDVLLEAGFRKEMITAGSLTKYLTLVKQTIDTLKKHGFIPQNVDVMSHILKYVDLDPHFYPEEMLDRSSTLLTVRISVLRAFLKRKFGLSDQELRSRSQNNTRLWNKSFTTINQNIRLMEDRIGMSSQSLGRNLYILALNPANTENILQEVQFIGEIDILTALKVRPKILCNTCGNLNSILKLFEEYGIPLNFNHGALKVFTLSYKTVKERLEELDEIEYFSVNKGHPRILTLITGQAEAKKRLKMLEDINLYPGSLNTLLTGRRMFERFLTDGHRQNSIRDIMFFLTNHFDWNFNELKKKLDKHPYWASVSLVEIGRNLKFLSKHLSREELWNCPLILFYPSEKIQDEFFKLESREGIDCCKENGRVKTEFVAPLLSYFLEKEVNFSLHGIWVSESSDSEAVDAPHVRKEESS